MPSGERAIAKARGDTFYYGALCPKRHDSPRYTSAGTCVACAAEYAIKVQDARRVIARRREASEISAYIEKLKVKVSSRGGTLLKVQQLRRDWAKDRSRSYVRVRCSEGHVFQMMAYKIMVGRYCRYCRQTVGEAVLRAILEETFAQPFPSVWPSWLLSPKGNRMELDCYCETLRLAFEYDGPQHKTNANVVGRDRIKEAQCAARNITLIRVEAVQNPYQFEDVVASLRSALIANDLDIEPRLPESINLKTDTLDRLKGYARAKGGELLSNIYNGMNTRLIWKCNIPEHPPWSQTPAHVFTSGTWCPLCAFNVPIEIKELQELARARDGTLVSSVCLGSKTNLEWKCHNPEHPPWFQTPDVIMNLGCWCPRCASTYPRPVICIETDEIFPSINSAAKAKNINAGNLRSVCIGDRQTAGGYRWAYLDGDEHG